MSTGQQSNLKGRHDLRSEQRIEKMIQILTGDAGVDLKARLGEEPAYLKEETPAGDSRMGGAVGLILHEEASCG